MIGHDCARLRLLHLGHLGHLGAHWGDLVRSHCSFYSSIPGEPDSAARWEGQFEVMQRGDRVGERDGGRDQFTFYRVQEAGWGLT